MTTILADIVTFEKLFKNKPKIRRFLFGRKDLKSESLFEKILSLSNFQTEELVENFSDILKYLWNEFQLWDKPEILTLVSF